MPTPGFQPFDKLTRKSRRRLPRDRFAGLPGAVEIRVVNPKAIEDARKPFCERCRRYLRRSQLEVHHIIPVGMNGARPPGDVPWNLICLGAGPGTCDCHDKAQQYKPGYTIEDMQAIVARRTT